jgi:hypothetical protein
VTILQNSGKVALCGSITALSLALLLIAGILPIDTYSLPAVAGSVFVVIAIEFGFKWSLISFFAVSILSFLFVPNKEVSIIFIMFFGYYPFSKIYIEKIKSNFLKIAIKLLIFNTSNILEFLLAIKLFSIPEETQMIFGISGPIFLLLAGNIVFWFYDILVFNMMRLYFLKFRNKLKKIMHL